MGHMERHGCPKHFLGVIKRLYQNVETGKVSQMTQFVINTGKEEKPVLVNKGVWQDVVYYPYYLKTNELMTLYNNRIILFLQ